jgi:glycosyltransferase involved in cell wall biosynthesis
MSSPIRVAHVAGSATRTGVESHLIALLPAFDPAEVEVTLFLPWEGPLTERLTELGTRFEFGSPTRKLAFAEERALARRWENQFDVVHAHGPRSIFWAARAARRARVPVFVATLHEMRWLNTPPSFKRTIWVELEGRALRSADRIITLAQTMKAEVARRFPGLADRLRVVHGTAPVLADPDRLPLADPGKREDGVLRLVAVARLDWFKAYDILLDALGLLATRGVRFTLDVCGQGPLLPQLEDQARRLGIVDRIRWLGQIADVFPVLLASHVYVTATRAEGLPVAVLEGMAFGLPVVGTKASGMEEVIVNEQTGLLIDMEPESERPARLAAAIERLAHDPELARRLGRHSAERARRDFHPRRIAAETTAVYREALGASGTTLSARAS